MCGNGGMGEERGCVEKKRSCVLRYILIIIDYLI